MQNYIIKDLFYFLEYIYLLQIYKHKRAKIKIKCKRLKRYIKTTYNTAKGFINQKWAEEDEIKHHHVYR